MRRLLARFALQLTGTRLPRTRGTLYVAGLRGEITIRRDAFGIPHIDATGDDDAWFAAGFCHGQDRAFQLELLRRIARGTAAELFGRRALALDRISRRVGFHRSAGEQLPALEPAARAMFEAYARGVNAGRTAGSRGRPHELLLLRTPLGEWEAADSLAVLKLQSFAIATDPKLARFKVRVDDGEKAMRAVDVGAALAEAVPAFGGSNAWALAPSLTVTGRPIVANDPHLSPALPAHWYLLHLTTPEWSLAGGSFVGAPGVAAGHNGFVAWGVTIAFGDDAELFIEEPDQAGSEVLRETIFVRGQAPHVEEIDVTPRGPVISPALDGLERSSLSLSASWLQPRALRGFLFANRARTVAELRELFAGWPLLGLNVVMADTAGHIGWQMTGTIPRRSRPASGTPVAPAESDVRWDDVLALAELPSSLDPPSGWIVSANHEPESDAFLGCDFLDPYRALRASEVFASRGAWTVGEVMQLQRDTVSLAWRELREIILAAGANDARAAEAVALLRDWNGDVSADSTAAAVFELFVAEGARADVTEAAPHAAEWALGRGFSPLSPRSMAAVRRTAALVRCCRESPALVARALAAAIDRLEAHQADRGAWSWGGFRSLSMRHAFSSHPFFGALFTVGPVRVGGDANTLAQASVDPLDPAGNPLFIASMRMTMDVGAWENSRFVLPSGQSGNPLSPHFADQCALWSRGDGVPIAWSPEAVRAAARATLTVRPS